MPAHACVNGHPLQDDAATAHRRRRCRHPEQQQDRGARCEARRSRSSRTHNSHAARAAAHPAPRTPTARLHQISNQALRRVSPCLRLVGVIASRSTPVSAPARSAHPDPLTVLHVRVHLGSSPSDSLAVVEARRVLPAKMCGALGSECRVLRTGLRASGRTRRRRRP